jgi:hypothetical protein
MQERKTPEPNRAIADSEATSDKTLADIEQQEQMTDSNTENSGHSDIPSPDGTEEEPERNTGEEGKSEKEE